MVEINPIKFEVEEAISHLDAWSKPKSVKTTLAWKMSKATIYYEPKGAVLVIGTWNCMFPHILNGKLLTDFAREQIHSVHLMTDCRKRHELTGGNSFDFGTDGRRDCRWQHCHPQGHVSKHNSHFFADTSCSLPNKHRLWLLCSPRCSLAISILQLSMSSMVPLSKRPSYSSFASTTFSILVPATSAKLSRKRLLSI